MASWQKDYLSRVRTLHSGPKLCDNDAGLRFIEQLPASVLVRILLQADFLAMSSIVDQIERRQRKVIRDDVRRALLSADDTLWECWVTTCFPRVTRLPAGSDTWRSLAARIIRLVCTTRLRVGAYDDPAPDLEPYMPFAPVIRWPAFRAALGKAVSCSELFGEIYRSGKETIDVRFRRRIGDRLWVEIISEGYRGEQGIRLYKGTFPPHHDRPLATLVGFCGFEWSDGVGTFVIPNDFVSDVLFDEIARRNRHATTIPEAIRRQTDALLKELFLGVP